MVHFSRCFVYENHNSTFQSTQMNANECGREWKEDRSRANMYMGEGVALNNDQIEGWNELRRQMNEYPLSNVTKYRSLARGSIQQFTALLWNVPLFQSEEKYELYEQMLESQNSISSCSVIIRQFTAKT